jgi:hypothetical protein
MSAEILRRAATLMRERAEAAVYVYAEGHAKAGQQVPWFDAADAYSFDDTDGPHIIGMSPAVALAVADWLDEVAADLDEWDGLRQVGFAGQMHDRALAVARAYLGEA